MKVARDLSPTYIDSDSTICLSYSAVSLGPSLASQTSDYNRALFYLLPGRHFPLFIEHSFLIYSYLFCGSACSCCHQVYQQELRKYDVSVEKEEETIYLDLDETVIPPWGGSLRGSLCMKVGRDPSPTLFITRNIGSRVGVTCSTDASS